MAALIMICGLPGSGKTTLARRIERERRAPRLCPDEWIDRLLAHVGDDAHAEKELHRLREPVEALQWELAVRLLRLGLDVILEWGFWSRRERRHYRALAGAEGAGVELIYLDVQREALWARLERRNAELPPGAFRVSREELDLWWSQFEPPGEDELGSNTQ